MAKRPAGKRTKTASGRDEADTNWAILGDLNNADIEALAFLVLMQAAKSAQEDVRDIMEQVKAINRQKAALRELLQALRCRTPFRAARDKLARVDDAVEELLDAVGALELDRLPDQLSEMGEMETLRLQMAMDRLSKLMSTLSNIMKKTSATAGQIAANMK